MKHFILSRLGKPGNAVVAAMVAVAAIGGWSKPSFHPPDTGACPA
jgi:hypothetical protein